MTRDSLNYIFDLYLILTALLVITVDNILYLAVLRDLLENLVYFISLTNQKQSMDKFNNRSV